MSGRWLVERSESGRWVSVGMMDEATEETVRAACTVSNCAIRATREGEEFLAVPARPSRPAYVSHTKHGAQCSPTT